MNYDPKREKKTSPPLSKAESGYVAGLRLPEELRTFLWSAALTVLYVGLYYYAYKNFLNVTYEYLGFYNYATTLWEFAFAFVCILVVLGAMPKKLSLPSDFFSWMSFTLVYIPTLVSSSQIGIIPGGSYLLSTTLSVSLALIVMVPRVRLPRKRPETRKRQEIQREVSPRIWSIAILSILVTGILIFSFGSIMSFAGYEDIYEQRAIAAYFGVGRLFGYIINWQTSVLSAILLAYAIGARKYGYAVIAIIGLIVVYMITGSKITFAIVGTVLFVNLLFSRGLSRKPYLLLLLPLSVLLAIVVLIHFSGVGFSDLTLFVISQVFMRAIGIQSVLTPIYVEFFSHNPMTYYSHVTGVGMLVQYPYNEPVGMVVGKYITSRDTVNANASFWASDGVAALGYWGVVIIGAVVGTIFSVLNIIARGANYRLMCLALVPFCMAAANTSIFTALVTSGGLIVFLVAPYVLGENASGARR